MNAKKQNQQRRRRRAELERDRLRHEFYARQRRILRRPPPLPPLMIFAYELHRGGFK